MIGCVYWIGALLLAGLLSAIPTVGPYVAGGFLILAFAASVWLKNALVSESPTAATTELHQPSPPLTREDSGTARLSFSTQHAMPVVGTGYREHDWGTKRGTGAVELAREPRNTHDPNAIKVMYGRHHIGYLPRERASLIAPLMDSAGQRAVKAAARFEDDRVEVCPPPELLPALGPVAGWKQLRPMQPWGRCDKSIEVDFEADHRRDVEAVFRTEGVHVGSTPTTLKGLTALLAPSGHPTVIAVLLHGRWIGNIAAPELAPYTELTRRLAADGRVLEVPANLWGLNDGLVRSNVRVALPDLSQIDPPGPLPTSAYVLLPVGSKIQVTGEERHLDELGALLDGGSERPVIAELHRLNKAGKNARSVVGVRVCGEDVGELTPTTSAHFLPLLEACDEEGVSVVCRATVKGNQLKADVVLDATKAGDLSDDWITQHVYRARAQPAQAAAAAPSRRQTSIDEEWPDEHIDPAAIDHNK